MLSGDGGYNAIDSNTGSWFASNPDTGDGELNIQECSSEASCNDSLFNVVVSSADLGGDDGSLYFPYILDPQSTSSLLVGTCRVWRGPRSGGSFSALSLNFETFGTGICVGTEANVIRALAAGGTADANGSLVIYATTDSSGPNSLQTPPGGNIWVTTNAAPVAGASSTFGNVTLNGPGGVSINPSQFPISGVAIDPSDPTGNTAYATVMGFTGGPGHVWQTTNAGTTWSDFSGTGANAIPDSPSNVVVIDPIAHMVYVGTDVGVFQSSTISPGWMEVGPLTGATSIGFLPNVAVTALAIFNSGGQKLLRASTYGRGVWQYNLLAVPDFQIAVSNTPLTVFAGGSAVFNGTLTAVNGYNNNVDLSCATGSTAAPSPCIANPVTLTPTAPPSPPATFTVTAGGTAAVADYVFNVQGIGFDPNGTTHDAALTLHVVSWSVTSPPSPNPVIAPVGGSSPPVSFQITAQGTFSQSVALTCSFIPAIPGATCAFTPGASFVLTNSAPVIVTASVNIPAGTTPGPYGVTVQASTAGSSLNTSFTADVGPNFVFTDTTPFPNVKAGSAGTAGTINISSQGGFAGTVTLSCVTKLSNSCSIIPATVSSFPATATLTINAGTLAGGSYQVSVQGVSGTLTNSLVVAFNVGDYSITGTQALTSVPGGSANANTTFTSDDSYSGTVALACDASALQSAQCTLTPAGSIVIGSGGVVAVAANVTAPGGAAVGTYNINLNTHDVAGEPIHTWTMPLTVQDFTFGVQQVLPLRRSGAGQSAIYNLTVKPVGASFVNAVSLTCSVVPANSTCTLAPNTVTPGSGPVTAVATIATSSTMAQGNYTFSVIGTSGVSHSVTGSLVVGNSLQLAVANPFPAGVAAGAQLVPATITLTSNYIGSVNASCGLSTLSGVQCTLTPQSPITVTLTPVTISVLLSLPNNALPGTYGIALNVADANGGPSGSITLPFTVVQDYSIGNFSAASQTIGPGQSITYNLSVSPVGAAYSNAITLNCSVFPAFSGTCTFSPNPVSPLSDATSAGVVMTVTAPSTSAHLWPPPARSFYSWWLAVVGILTCGSGRKRLGTISVHLGIVRMGMMMALLFFLLSCGGGSNGGITPPTQGTPATYTITVTGSPASISQPAGSSVTLIVQ